MEHLTNQQKKHAIRPGEIVIEIDEENTDVKVRMVATDIHDPLNPDKMKIIEDVTVHGNRHIHFPPVDIRSNGGATYNFIRTRRVLMRDGEDTRFMMDPALRSIDMIPGERIHLDIANKVGRITDAIFDPENDAMYQKLKDIGVKIHGASRPFMSGIYVEQKFRDDTAMWNWAYHMRRLMDGNQEHCGGPPQHPGCSATGTRFCRPIQNCDQMPSMVEILKTGKVKIPLPPMTKEMADHFDDTNKEHDPDYKPMDRIHGEAVLTPFLAGVGQG